MRSVLQVIRHGLRLLPLVLVLALVVPGSGVRPTTIGLMKVQPAEAYDFADGVVWTLVLGEDAGTTPHPSPCGLSGWRWPACSASPRGCWARVACGRCC